MEVEFKHIAAYLPYGLKAEIEWNTVGGKRVLEILSCGSYIKKGDIFWVTTENGGDVIVGETYFKPILRPLSDLTKEIEVNGEKFVPNYVLNDTFRKQSRDLIPYKGIDNDFDLELEIETDYNQVIDLFDGYLIVQKLLEWHFDIYGLIESGLAVDINTI